MNSEKQQHESFGMAGFSRVSSNRGTPLFGSSIRHSNTIVFRVSEAEVDRKLEQDWYHSKSRLPLIEIEMSQSQFAEMITSMNMGDGVPVTLRYVNGVKREDPPHGNKVEQHSNEFKQRMREYSDRIKKDSASIRSMIEKRLPKKEQEELKNILDSMIMEIESNIPFYEKQFIRQMEKTQMEAKAEVEAFVNNKIHSAGLSALIDDSKKLINLE